MVMQSKTFSDGGRDGGFIVSESPGRRSREQIMLSALAALTKAGTVLGEALLAAPVTAAKAGGNTGNGTIAMDGTTPILDGAVKGTYTVRFLTATTFRVEKPNGDVIGDGATGQAFSDDVKFTITAGGTPFVAGDGFDITIADGTLQYAPLDLTKLDGRQVALAVLFAQRPIKATAQRAVCMARDCEVNGNLLIWPAGISAPQKKIAEAQLAAKGIIVRY